MDLPRQLGPYRLVERIGRGGMAEVFLAEAFGASGFEKKVAVKTLLPELRSSGEHLRLLIEEAKLGARFSHRNLVGVHDLGVDDGVYYVRMDWVDGRDLHTLLRAARPTPPLALFVASEVALALDCVHRATDDRGRALGLVHRDVSPANILVSRAGEVKLADFGVAKATSLADTTRANVRKGKYAYMSPEQVAGDPLGAASDQFALGVTLHEMLLGRRPFDGHGGSDDNGSPLETMRRITAAEPPDLAALPPDLARLLWRCLARDPAARFPSAGDLHHAIVEARMKWPEAGPPELASWTARALGLPALQNAPGV